MKSLELADETFVNLPYYQEEQPCGRQEYENEDEHMGTDRQEIDFACTLMSVLAANVLEAVYQYENCGCCVESQTARRMASQRMGDQLGCSTGEEAVRPLSSASSSTRDSGAGSLTAPAA